MLLPYGAGPDYDAHFDAARFVYSEGRLAVLPDDIPKLRFTAYGSTRTLRPPLPYLVAATSAKALAWTGIDSRLLFRMGSAILCALSVSLAFLLLARYFGSVSIGFCGAFLMGLMPQFTFIASHLNDDSAAIFSVTFLVYCISRLLETRVGGRRAIVTGIALGLVLISKFTAWLFLPFAALAILIFGRPENGRWMLTGALLLGGTLLGGGWWIMFNLWHYGLNDPLLFKIGAQLNTQFGQIDPDRIRGFAAEGVSLAGLILGNYKGFMHETLTSTIGNLDWLRLRLGFPQYAFYSVVLLAGLVYIPLRWVLNGLRWAWGDSQYPYRRLVFETLLFAAVIFQFAVYVFYQWAQEIQVQGKYLLPVLICALILSLSGIESLGRIGVIQKYLPSVQFGSNSARWPLTTGLVIAITLIVHVDAHRRFVVPYYYPESKILGLGKFVPIDLTDLELPIATRNLNLNPTDEGWLIQTITSDSQIEFNPDLCDHLFVNNLIEIRLNSDGPGVLQLFWSLERGFADRQGESSTTAKFAEGENVIILAAGTGQCRRLRLDPTNVAGQQILIRSISVAPLSIQRRPYYFRLLSS